MLVHYHFDCKTANLLNWQQQMLVHYHFHCKTANLQMLTNKCSFIITSIVRLLTYKADNTNARSLSLTIVRLLTCTADNTNARSLSTAIVRLLTYTADNTNARSLFTSIVRLLTYTADNTNARSLSLPLEDCYLTQLTTQMLINYHFNCKSTNLHSWQHRCSFIITSIVRLLTYTADQHRMLVHYSFHCKTANLHS